MPVLEEASTPKTETSSEVTTGVDGSTAAADATTAVVGATTTAACATTAAADGTTAAARTAGKRLKNAKIESILTKLSSIGQTFLLQLNNDLISVLDIV